MPLSASPKALRIVASLGLLAGSVGSAAAQLDPAFQRSVTSLGQQSPSAFVSGTVWLPLHNKAALDAEVQAMYTPGSPTFQKFAGPEALGRFAPSAAELQSVRQELVSHHLSVVAENAFSLKFEGATSDFEAAFHTVVNRYRTPDGAVLQATASAPTLGGNAAGLAGAVTGISGLPMRPLSHRAVKSAIGPANGTVTGQPADLRTASAAPQRVGFYSSHCLTAPQTVKETFPYIVKGVGPQGSFTETWTGLIYGGSFAPDSTTLVDCAYGPEDVSSFYGLRTAYEQGYNGAGQTIAIIDAYGSPTLQQDLASFDSLYRLPPVTGTSLEVTQTKPFPVSGLNTPEELAWAEQATLDVEWTHALAPGANIKLITTPTGSDDDLQQAVLSVITNHSATIINGSYGTGERLSSAGTLATWDEICEMAAFQGIAANFPTGDYGYGASQSLQGKVDVSSPADSPYATAVGGTSIAYAPDDGAVLQTGWGTRVVLLNPGTGVPVPASPDGNGTGSGGGVSTHFSKPGYQSSLQGAGRMLPDISALADPFTGVQIVFTTFGKQTFIAKGGTGLATTIFSAEWALLNQRFGFSLGQAAPYFQRYAGTPAITDILPPSSQLAVRGTVQINSDPATSYSAEALMPAAVGGFTSALYQDDSGNLFAIGFGMDEPPSSLDTGLSPPLVVSQGWDPVTGWGSLNIGALFSSFNH